MIFSFQKHNGSFANVVKKADKSAQSLLKLVLNDIPSFQDVADYKGKKGKCSCKDV